MASNWYPIGVDWLGTRDGDGLVASLIYGLRGTGRRALDRRSIRPRRRHVGLWRGGCIRWEFGWIEVCLFELGGPHSPWLVGHWPSGGASQLRWGTAQRSFCL